MLLGLRTVGYATSDLNRAKAWYSEVFGITPYFDEPFYVGFNVGGYELGLTPDGDDNAGKTTSPVTYWGVEDVHKVYQHVLAHGATQHEEPHNVGGEIIVASVYDPFGNVVGFIYNPGFSLP